MLYKILLEQFNVNTPGQLRKIQLRVDFAVSIFEMELTNAT